MIRQSRCSSGQLAQAVEQHLVGQPGEHLLLGALGGVVVQPHVLGGQLETGAAGLEVVGAEVAGDRHQPGAEVLALPAEAAHAPQRPEERLGGEVLGEARRAGPVVEEAVDRAVVVVVELAERLGVAAAGQLDQGDQAAALGLALLRRRGLVGVVVACRRRGGPPTRRPRSGASTQGRRRAAAATAESGETAARRSSQPRAASWSAHVMAIPPEHR